MANKFDSGIVDTVEGISATMRGSDIARFQAAHTRTTIERNFVVFQ